MKLILSALLLVSLQAHALSDNDYDDCMEEDSFLDLLPALQKKYKGSAYRHINAWAEEAESCEDLIEVMKKDSET